MFLNQYSYNKLIIIQWCWCIRPQQIKILRKFNRFNRISRVIQTQQLHLFIMKRRRKRKSKIMEMVVVNKCLLIIQNILLNNTTQIYQKLMVDRMDKIKMKILWISLIKATEVLLQKQDRCKSLILICHIK
jgi:hypothetical protein